MRWTKIALAAVVSFSMGMTACAPTHPDYDEVESNISSPSGDVSSDTTSSAWSGYKAKGSATSLTPDAGKTKFVRVKTFRPVSLSDYLVNAGIPKAIVPAVTQVLPTKDNYSHKKIFSEEGGLVAKGSLMIPGCFSGSADGENASFTVNLGCFLSANPGSGSVSVRLMNFNGDEGQMEIVFNNACDAKGNCVHGALGLKASTSMPGLSRSGEVVYAYELHVKKSDGREAHSKGGFRASYNGSNNSAKLEVVGYVKGPEGREGTVVLEFAAKNDEASFIVRGKNGSFSCGTSDGGKTGSCTASNGNGNFTWKADLID